MNSSRTLSLAVDAVHLMMNADNVGATSKLKQAIFDGTQVPENVRVKLFESRVSELHELDEFNKKSLFIAVLVAAARDHLPHSPESIY
jgi:hypothetical protein